VHLAQQLQQQGVVPLLLQNLQQQVVHDSQQQAQHLVPVPVSNVHTAAVALSSALWHLPKLWSCKFLGRPVPEGILHLLPPSLQSLQVTQRAFQGPFNLATAPGLVALDLPDLQPSDTLPPSLHKLVLFGRQRLDVQPLLPLTPLGTLEILGCTADPEFMAWAGRQYSAFHVNTAAYSELLPSVMVKPKNLPVDRCSKIRFFDIRWWMGVQVLMTRRGEGGGELAWGHWPHR
jgi:hypothetical protein